MSFFTGFAEGFATSVDRRLRDDLERTYDKVSKLSALRAKTIVEGSTKHANEFKSYETGLNSLASIVGNDMDLVDYLVNQAGGSIEAATAKAQEVQNAVANSGGKETAYSLLNMERRQGNSPKITATQIAKKIKGVYVPPPKVTGETAVGLNQLFNYDISPSINRETDQLLSASGVKINQDDAIDLNGYTTLTSKGERSNFIRAYSEDDPKTRAFLMSSLATNLHMKLANLTTEDDPTGSVSNNLNNQIIQATNEVEIYKHVSKNIDLSDANNNPKSFTPTVYQSMKSNIMEQLVNRTGSEVQKVSGLFFQQGGKLIQALQSNVQAKKLDEKAEEITNDLNTLQTMRLDNGKTFFDGNPTFVETTRTEIINLLAKNIDYKLILSGLDGPTPQVSVVPKRISNESSILDEFQSETEEILEEQIAMSDIKPAFDLTIFTGMKNQMDDVVSSGGVNKNLKINLTEDQQYDNENGEAWLNKTRDNKIKTQSEAAAGGQQVVEEEDLEAIFNEFKRLFPNSTYTRSEVLGMYGTAKPKKESMLSRLFNPTVSPEVEYQRKLKKEAKAKKGLTYNVTGQKFNGIEINKITVASYGTITLDITRDNGTKDSISMLHQDYDKIIEAGFDLQKAVESAK